MRDPLGGNLDRVQIVKGWVDGSGETHERIYNVAWSDDRELDADGGFAPVGNTVEEATADLDVGIKIFTGLNVSHSLPVPVIVRFDYHGNVPGARERAQEQCKRVSDAFHSRYSDLSEKGLLHTLQVVRDIKAAGKLEILDCSVKTEVAGGH